MKKKLWFLFLPFIIILCLDVLSKQFILSHFPLYDSRPVIPGFFNLVHYQNKGAAFGFLGGTDSLWRDVLLIFLPMGAILGILLFAFLYPSQKVGVLVSLGGILGGALGNLLDRIRFQAVVDFLDIYWRSYHWPAFNVADSAITLGVFYLAYYFLMET